MQTVILPTTDGDTITDDLFGGNFLADRYTLGTDGRIEAAIDRLGVSGLRYPGGSLTERLFDIRNPDARTAVEDDGSIVDFVPLSQFLAYAEAEALPVTIVIPTRDFLGSRTDANGDRFPSFDEDALRAFVRDVATGEYGEADIAAFEIGNEYWGSGEMSAVEYGRLSSKMAEVIDDELEQVAAENGAPTGIDILVQTGTNFGSSELSLDYAGRDAEEVLAELNAAYGTDFGDEVIFPQGSLNWRRINDELVRREFDDDEMDAIDGVVTHLYSKEPVQPGQREFGLETIQKTWIDETPDLELWVTEWNQSAAEPRFDSDEDFGLIKAHEVLDTFETMVAAGVDQAHVWPLLQNTRNALQPDSLDGELSPSGALFSMMSEALPGKQLLDFAPDDETETEFAIKGAEVHGYYGEGEMVLYVASTSDTVETVSFDLSSMVGGGGRVTGQLLGVRDGDAPGSTAARAETEWVPADEFYDDGQVVLGLGPGEIMEIRIDGFTKTKGFARAMADAKTADDPTDLLFLPPDSEHAEVDDPEEEAETDDADDGLLDALAMILGLVPLLALAGLAG